MKEITHVTGETFDDYVSEAPLAIVDFSADWCPPCRMMDPIYERMALKYGDQIKFLAVDGEASPDLIARYSVQAMPTFAFFRCGQIVERLVGARPGGKFEAEIQAFASIESNP